MKKAKIAKKNVPCEVTDSNSKVLITRIIPKRKFIHPLLKEIELLHNETVTKPKQYPYPYSENNRNDTVIIKIPQNVENDAQSLARQGKTPQAMKQIMNLTGIGMSVAKDYIDSLL
ncbi:MAG: hypothetical protein ACTFAL_14780 [Candidatus Electronema sp. V4]|uniref:hypothetical protein n=1 Tax=Candidatus Electronema sp. V4 TaxID=3454756 RepID=UPI0040557FD8